MRINSVKTLVVTYKTVLKSIHELIEIGMHKMKSRDDHTKAHELFAEAFNVPRESRSHEYKSGVLAALLYRFEGIKIMNNCPYGEGTAELDAF